MKEDHFPVCSPKLLKGRYPLRTPADLARHTLLHDVFTGQFGVEFTITVETGVSPLRGMHLCFRAPNRASVREFHGAALAAGGYDDGAPGVRPQYHSDYLCLLKTSSGMTRG